MNLNLTLDSASSKEVFGELTGDPQGETMHLMQNAFGANSMNAFENEARSLLSQGKKLDAVKLYKDQTGVSLMEAKQAVEALERGGALPGGGGSGGPRAAAGSFEAELISLLQQGQKIEAVKRYRERTGVSLLEAKNAVEALQAGRSLPTPRAMDEALAAELISSLQLGERREAIRLYQQRTGASLPEARRAVDSLARQHDIPQRDSALGTSLLVLAIVVAALLLLLPGVLFVVS